MELSPEDIRKDKGKVIPDGFIVYIYFEDFCSTCNPFITEIEDLCDMCKAEIGEDTLKEWLLVKKIFQEHDFPTLAQGAELLPGVDKDVLEESLARPLRFNSNYYRIWTPEELDAAEREELEDEDQDGDSGEEEKKDGDGEPNARKSLNARRSHEKRGSIPRKVSQIKLTFPATLD